MEVEGKNGGEALRVRRLLKAETETAAALVCLIACRAEGPCRHRHQRRSESGRSARLRPFRMQSGCQDGPVRPTEWVVGSTG